MKNSVILLEEYKRNLLNKEKIDNGEISLEDLSLEELEGVSSLYMSEIKSISAVIEKKKANIERLKKENEYLRKLLRNGGNK